MTCHRCGAALPAGARFCPACGAEVDAPAAKEERKLVSILFVDLVGSTAAADGADPEDVRDRNQVYFDVARDRIAKHGGVVEKYVGDAVMAVFGTPLARLDDAERAVRAGLAILDGLEHVNAAQPGIDLHARVGVCTGEVVVHLDAAPDSALATGDVVNMASRLQTAAPSDRMIVGPETYALARQAFAFEEIAAIVAKGKRDPIPAYLVVGPHRVDEPTFQVPIVGRDRELSLLRAVWDRAATARRPHLVAVVGPPGIGKTRLGYEVAAEVDRGGGSAYWGRCLAYEEQTPYRAVGEVVRRVAGIYENDSAAEARRKLAACVETRFPAQESETATRFLSLLLGLGIDARADETIHLYFTVRRLVELLADERPVLLVLEDLHWADDALLELIDYLVTNVQDAPVVFLALARPEFLESRLTWGAGTVGQTVLPLDPLGPEDAGIIAAATLGDEDAVARVVARAEGNPLFIEELAASIGDGEPDALPPTVRAAIAARIDALPSDARTTLLDAAVVGQTFWRGVVAGIGGTEDVDGALVALESRGLVTRHPLSQVDGDVEYAFRHGLIHDVAYATLPRASRRERHAATAEVVERSVTDTAPLAWILAFHWREAGEPSRAIAYLLAAAERARDALAVEETYDLLTRALDLAETDEERRRIRLRRGLAMWELDEHGRAEKELGDLQPELTGHDEIEALLARSGSALWTERSAPAIALGEEALARAEEGGHDDLLPAALARLGGALSMRGEPGDLERSIALADRATAIWRPGERTAELAEHYHLAADVHYWSADYRAAFDLSRLAAETAGLEPQSAEYVLRGAGMGGLILAGMGRYEEAIAATDAAIEIARRMGRSNAVVTNYSTGPLREIFALEEAHRRSAEIVERLGPSDFNMPWINARTDLLGAQLLMGDLGAVEASWEAVWDESLVITAWERWLISGRLAAYRADLELERDRLDAAETWAVRAVEMARATRRRKYESVALTTLGRVLTATGRASEAAGPLAEAISVADAVGSPLLRWQARAAMGTADAAVGDPAATGHLVEAAAIAAEVAASLAPERAAGYRAAPPVAAVLAAIG